MFRAIVLGFAKIFRDVAAESFMDAELDGAAAEAVDAEREVEQGTERGQKPDDADPDRRGSRVAFVEQRVAGGEETGEQVEGRREVRPEAGDFFKPVHRRILLVEKNARREVFGMATLSGIEPGKNVSDTTG